MKKDSSNQWMDRIISCLAINGVISDSEIEAYRFGIEMLILKIMHVVSYIFIAAAMRRISEFLIIFSVLCVFRRNTGGFHASTRKGCYFFSCIVIGIALWLCNIVVVLWLQHVLVLILLLIMSSCAPVRNRNRRMDDGEISYFKRRLKRESVLFCLVYIFCLVVNREYLTYLLFIGVWVNTILTVLGKVQFARGKVELIKKD